MNRMATTRTWYGRVMTAASAMIVGIFVALFGQGIWSALIATNLSTTPAIPWAVPVMALVLWIFWQYLGGRWQPRSTSDERRLRLRANAIPANVFAWAVISGALSVIALAGWWAVISHVERISGSLLPDMSKYPTLTVALVVAMGSLVSPIFEQAGFWGYCQVKLEREFSGPTAILMTALLFGLLPHPPMHVLVWPKLILFFFAGLTFSTMAYLTKSILPGLTVHIFSLLAFFTLVFRTQPQTISGTWLWIHAAQMAGCAVLGVAAFIRLHRLTEPTRAPAGKVQGRVESVVG
jgi:membrane protease YdiL (CAAX protease family)